MSESADKEEQLKSAQHHKRALQMQLHSLGGGKGTSRTDRSDMLCFYCVETSTGQVFVFVCVYVFVGMCVRVVWDALLGMRGNQYCVSVSLFL